MPVSFLLLFWASFSVWLWTNGLVIELPFFVPYLPEGLKLGSFLALVNGLSSLSLFFIPLCLKLGLEKSCYVAYFFGFVFSFSINFLWDQVISISTSVFPDGFSFGLLFNSWLLLSFDTLRFTMLCMLVSQSYPDYFMSAVLLGTTSSGFFETTLAFIQGRKLVRKKPNLSACKDSTRDVVSNPHRLSTDFTFGPQFALTIYCAVFITSAFAFILLRHFGRKYFEELQYQRLKAETVLRSQNEAKEATPLLKQEETKPDIINLELFEKVSWKEYGKNFLKWISEEFDDKQSHKYFLWFVWFSSSATIYNFMSPFFTYTALPYSQKYYTLSVTLWGLCLPLTTILAQFVPAKRVLSLASALAFHVIVCATLLGLAVKSPETPLKCTEIGGVVIIVLWMAHAVSGYYSFASSCYRLNEMERRVPGSLKWGTIGAQCGDVMGAFSSFILINFTDVFTTQNEEL